MKMNIYYPKPKEDQSLDRIDLSTKIYNSNTRGPTETDSADKWMQDEDRWTDNEDWWTLDDNDRTRDEMFDDFDVNGKTLKDGR